jgi:murein L,D-transpeptidase YcbB/YkuD
MKTRHLVVATSAALLSFGALAQGQQQSQGSEQRAPQAQSDSATVRQAQEALKSRGYAATPQGLREFQQANGMDASGMLDQQTLAALGVSASSGAPSGSGASSDRAPQRGDRPKY